MKKYLVGIMVVGLAFAAGCEKAQMEELTMTEEVTTEAAVPDQMPKASVSAATVVVGDKEWTVELASSAEERRAGLGGRESLPANTGMWFVFPEDSVDPFWMKDTLFDLDMIFVGADMKVVDIKPNNKAGSEDFITPVVAYRYVLEIPAGSSSGVALGDVVDYRMGPK